MGSLSTFAMTVIYTGAPSERTLCVVADLNADGIPEVIIGARRPRGELYWIGRDSAGGWHSHTIDDSCGPLEAGGAVLDIAGRGGRDLVAGEDSSGNTLFWWECPDDPAAAWTRREIARLPGRQSHDQFAADLDGDGRDEVYFWNQGARLLMRATVPDEPTVSPWPTVEAIAQDVAEEGLAAADVDGDGRPELIAGQSWYRLHRDGRWQRHEYARGYVSPKVAAADFDGDGRPEIVLSEGDASIFRGGSGRLVLFHPPDDPEALWEPEVLHDDLMDPHTLQVADFDGDGRPDLLVGELGDPNGRHARPPAVRIYHNQSGALRETVVDTGIGIHEGRAYEVAGRTGIVGKPYQNLLPDHPRDPGADRVYLWLPADLAW